MLIGMPLASTMGLAGSPVKPMVDPVAAQPQRPGDHAQQQAEGRPACKTPKALKPLADKAKAAGEPLTFAMTFPPGTHAMWMRYWLASGGIHPDKDVTLITIPPPQMVANMKVDKMDGFCVGEPWNARAIADGIGFTADHHAADVEGPPGKGLRVHRGVRREEPEDGEGGPQGAAPGERAPRQAGEPPRRPRR